MNSHCHDPRQPGVSFSFPPLLGSSAGSLHPHCHACPISGYAGSALPFAVRQLLGKDNLDNPAAVSVN